MLVPEEVVFFSGWIYKKLTNDSPRAQRNV